MTALSLSLASSSPRRRQLLALGGWMYNILPAQVDETPLPGEHPRAYVLRLARDKALAAAAHSEAQPVIISADTSVVDQGSILGKPLDEQDARLTLKRLRGRAHHVYTGLAVYHRERQVLLTDLCITPVPMRQYSDEEIESYIATGDPMDKAGSYAIQHNGFHPVPYLNGCYANVVGLPLCHLARLLRRLEITAMADIPAGCQATMQYTCPIYPQIVSGYALGDLR